MQSASLRVCANVHKASALVWPIYDQHNTSLSEHILLLTMCYFLYSHMIKLGILFPLCCWEHAWCSSPTRSELLVTCTTCSSAPSACWRSPVRFSSRSSLCEEFGMWWGRTEEWRVLERHLPGWSDRTKWSLALQDRDSQTSSQNRGSKRLKGFHPCLSSCRLYAVFTSSVWEYKVEMCSQTNQQWNKTWSAFIFPLQRGLIAVYWMLNVSLQTECSCSTRCSILGQ